MTTTEAEAPGIPQPTFPNHAYGVYLTWFGGNGGMAACGHIPDLRFLAACNHLARVEGLMRNIVDEPFARLDDVLVRVQRCWAVPVSPDEAEPGDDYDWYADLGRDITEETPGAIAITVLDL